MREYARLSPTFWTGSTGKALRKMGHEAIVVALYLVSAPGSNMLGLYYQPTLFMAHETGLGIDGASKGLAGCINAGFCSYDDDTEMVFVHTMALWQIAGQLSKGDKRCVGIQRDYEALPDNPFLAAWFDRYAEAFHLTRRREFQGGEGLPEEGGMPSPLEAPSKPSTGTGTGTGASTSAGELFPPSADAEPAARSKPPAAKPASGEAKTSTTWTAYSAAYSARYKAEPLRNAKVNGLLARLVDQVGAQDAPAIASHYLRCDDPLYARGMHPVDLLLRDASKIRTLWATNGRSATSAGSSPFAAVDYSAGLTSERGAQ